MASIRNLKKEINKLMYLIIEDSLAFMEVFPEGKMEEAQNIIQEILDLRNDLIARANHINGKDNPKLVKAHFNAIISEMNQGCDKAYSQLESLIKNK